MDSDRIVDLAIIGGGPAGTAAALEACRRGLRVAIWERDRFPRDKVCGEFISAESTPFLQQEIPEAMAKSAVIRSAEFVSPGSSRYTFALPAPARGLSRYMMDEALWSAVQSRGARTHSGEAVQRVRKKTTRYQGGAAPAGSIWEVESTGGQTATAQMLLVACGRWWSIDGFPSPPRDRKRGLWVGAKARFSGIMGRDVVEMYFFPGGYCGVGPVEDGIYNVCCLVHESLVRGLGTGGAADLALWLKRVAQHPALAGRLCGAIQASETLATAPVRMARRQADCDGALLAGDAAGFLDPFTGDGISQALQAGRLAAEVLAEADGPQTGGCFGAAARYQSRLNRAVQGSHRVATLLRAWVRAPSVIQSALAFCTPWTGEFFFRQTRWRDR